jgi:DNA-binding MarR family transcriptional regulator
MFIMSPTKVLLTGVVREWSEVFMHRSMRDFKRFMDATDLSFSQISILMRLAHGGSAGVSEIGGQLGVTNAAASQAVDRLVGLGLIERTEDPQDRRAKRLALTQKGRALVEKGVRARSQWIEDLAQALPPEQQSVIVSALTLLTEASRKTKE